MTATRQSSRRSRAALPLAGALALLVGGGCAGPLATGPAPAAAVREVRAPAGHYTGTITGRELATASSLSTIGARLTIAADGRWTMATDNGRATGRVAHSTPNLLVLTGRFAAGPAGEGAPAWYRLRRQDGDHVLAGSARSSFSGHTVSTGIQLRRTDDSHPEAR